VFKLFVTLAAFLLVALALFGLRQQQREISAQCVKMYREIEDHKDTLRSQRVDISRATSPTALATGLKNAGMDPGDALVMRANRTVKKPPAPRNASAVETDLIAPLRDSDGGSGHSNASRPHQ
jgi:hypothetical protein